MERVYHAIKYLAIYALFGLTMGLSSIEKITEPVPDWFSEQFAGTFVETVPGLGISWFAAGVLEAAVALLLLASIVTGEFLPGHRRTLLRTGLAVAAFTFMMLAIGQRLTFQFDGAASLFFYFGATMATLLVIHRDEVAERVEERVEERVSA
jgi:hypothetical protein